MRYPVLRCDNDKPASAPTGKDVSDCLFSINNSWFTGAFVVLGTVLGVRRKSYMPLASAALLGSLGDGLYGYFYGCADIIKDYENSKTGV